MKNLLKYGIMLLAMVIASMGLLWADTCAAVEVDTARQDTTIAMMPDSSCINDTLADTERDEESPIGDAMLPLLALACMYALYNITRVYRRKRRV